MARRGLRYALVLSSASLLLAGGHWLLGTQVRETPAHGVTASESAWRADEPDVQTLTTGSTAIEPGREDSGSFSVSTSATATAPVVQWPLTTRDASVTDGFGPRQSPCAGCSSNHRGLDFGAAAGTPVGAIAAGTVISVDTAGLGGLGVHVVLEHIIGGHTVQSVYGHFGHGTVTVRVGDSVEVGAQVGAVGSTGASTGPHLHLEVIVDGMHVDPLTFLQRYADGRDVEITSRPELPWVPADEPGGQGSGAGWDPGQTVTDAPATPSTPGGDAGVVTPAPSPSQDPDPATESSETPPSTTEPVAPDSGETDGGGSEAPPPEDVVPEMPQSTPESAPDASVVATSSE